MKSIALLVFAFFGVAAVPSAMSRSFNRTRQMFEQVKSNQRYGIFLADEASISNYSYTAAILTDKNELIGGGFIYKDKWIVTSGIVATNTSASRMRVRVGSSSAISGGQLFNVELAINPPLYEYCVGLLKLDKKITFGQDTSSIDIVEKTTISGSAANVTGFGKNFFDYTNYLQAFESTIYDVDSCRDTFWPHLGQEFRTAVELCATGSSCFGDSGNPVVQDGKAIGVYIEGAECMSVPIPMFYCDLKRFHRWIDFTIERNM